MAVFITAKLLTELVLSATRFTPEGVRGSIAVKVPRH